MADDAFWKYFKEIYGALPRQGPGARASTERALRMLPPLSAEHRILDVGCGTGAQTLDLARATAAQIVAVDNHPPFVERLRARAAEAGLFERITAEVGDMGELRFPDASFDVVWSEGAIFIIGLDEGLARWRRLLKPGGHVVVSEFCWFCDEPPTELVALHRGDFPELGDVPARRRSVTARGYTLLGDFVLPAHGWWENFYVPLAERLERFRAARAGNAEALAVADTCQQEIDMYLKYPDAFGYVFFVMQRDEGGAP